jgi:uncharacterized membrane protein YhaH (DUF805 family)
MEQYVANVKLALSRYSDFQGRSGRSEYWYFVLFNILMSFLANVLDRYLIVPALSVGLASIALTLVLIVPGLAVSVRRLHDVGKSGWWLLIAVVPVVGLVYLVYLFVQPGKTTRSASPTGAIIPDAAP